MSRARQEAADIAEALGNHFKEQVADTGRAPAYSEDCLLVACAPLSSAGLCVVVSSVVLPMFKKLHPIS